ncbi:MAG: YfbU family protein [Burkholderiaceae bacterium]|nr:YfbU family protein [Burkholderiaceae bacterium]
MNMPPKNERFEMRVDEELLGRVDRWRGEQDDVPSRAEAMRRLVELGLGPSSHAVHFSDGEKMLMLMMRDIYKGLKLQGGETDFDFIAQVIYGGHYWAPRWNMSGLFHSHADKPKDVSFTVDVLDMWSFIESAYTKLSKTDKERLAADVPYRGKHVQFLGFDGNNETDHLSIARFIIEEMNRFSGFKGRDLNSHSRTLERYRRMLAVFLPMRPTLDGTSLSVNQLIKLLNADEGAEE